MADPMSQMRRRPKRDRVRSDDAQDLQHRLETELSVLVRCTQDRQPPQIAGSREASASLHPRKVARIVGSQSIRVP